MEGFKPRCPIGMLVTFHSGSCNECGGLDGDHDKDCSNEDE